ncbi:MAG: hypothetical protein AAFV29_03095, partial [Myxococcota bacterium]
MQGVRLSATVAAIIIASLSSSATASPWTLPAGRGVLWTGFTYQTTDREFLDRGGSRIFPLAGQFDAATFVLGGRVGLTNSLEVEVSVPFSLVSYQADPVILLPDPPPIQPGESQFDRIQRNVINLSRTRSGLGDINLTGRYRLLRGPLVAAVEFGIKVPMGYEGPAGTFGEDPETEAEFRANLATFVSPTNVEDDVTLGDGQVDLQTSLLVGYALRFGMFFRLNAGYKLRLGGAADQVIGLARIGQSIGRRFLVYGGAQIAYSIQDGRPIGISVSAIDPTLPATEYIGDTNLD